MVVPLFVGRERSIRALDVAIAHDKDVLLAAQKRAKTNEPSPDDIFQVGTLSTIIQLVRLPDGTVKVLVEGKQRARVRRYFPRADFFQVEVEELDEEATSSVELEALMRSVQATFEAYVKLNKRIPPEMVMSVTAIEDPSRLADTIAAQLQLKLADKQQLLETGAPGRRLERLYELMQAEIEILQVEKKIRVRVKKQMERSQKEYYLNEQMQAIQKELGEKDEFKNEVAELEDKLKAKQMPDDARDRAKAEIRKLKMMAPMSAEATVVRNYVDWLLALPWEERTEEKLDVDESQKILDEDHYGLKKPKERIIEYLAVQALSEKLKGPILCFVGPPGVGKTSLGRSIGRATGRKFVRLSLGGVRDEAEIRGHRRTYIGALPGKIIQSMKRAGSGNPVMLLDEVDKMSMDFRGDPSAALLEVLDPEQNEFFNDHYLDLDYDLSHVLFVCTANTLHGVPPALQDRMEIIELSGYTEYEKLNIATRFLVDKQKDANGIAEVDAGFTEEAIRLLVNRYTRESGVRNLEREIASICRKIARQVVKEGKDVQVKVTTRKVAGFLGPPKFKYGRADVADEVGVAQGLAVTMTGGDLLTTEVTVMHGRGKYIITGKLGDVMQESARAAMSYVRSRAEIFGLERDFYQHVDLHIHFPEGAIPKDGPSAGITMATAIVSALTGIPVRRDVAMTGEITLRGRVLEIGGLREKVLAAHRAGALRVLCPTDNKKDLREIPRRVRKAVEIVLTDHMDDVLRLALTEPDRLFGRPPADDVETEAEEAGLEEDAEPVGAGEGLEVPATH